MLDSTRIHQHLAIVSLILLLLNIETNAQHRGDNLSFQGLNEINGIGVKAAAMGNADVANLGDLSSIFSNPAGLAGIKNYKISFSANNFEKKWWENQDYRPNRQFTNLSFYLDGLYIPNPENNGKWDYDAFFDDSTYIVNDPALGLDPYSEEAAIWKKTEKDFIFNNVAVAIPLNISDFSFVLSGAYSQQNNILDYDRNTTYLDPHIGYNGYRPLEERVTSAEDTVKVNWYDYTRTKKGDLKQITFAVSSQVTNYLSLGLGVNILNGESDDFYSLNKIGYFNLIGGANSFKFSYDTLNTSVSGLSKYSGVYLNLGAVIKLNRINIGIKINTPYTLKREWDYQTSTSNSDTSSLGNLKGTDELEFPISYALGISFNPIDDFRLAFEIERANYSKAEFNLANPDSTLNNWADQTFIRFGVEYNVYDFITILAGYSNKTELFIPDGAAIKNKGPNATTYSFGLSLDFDIGRFDFAYQTRTMKYIDSYFSNTNYSTETYNNLLAGYTFTF